MTRPKPVHYLVGEGEHAQVLCGGYAYDKHVTREKQRVTCWMCLQVLETSAVNDPVMNAMEKNYE